MKVIKEEKNVIILRTVLALVMILLAAALRVIPHPWNFAPIGAIALFSGAFVRDTRLAFIFPLMTLMAGDIFIGFHKLIPLVYASFLLSVAIGMFLRNRTSVPRIAGATLLAALQFFLITNFGVWAILGSYPKTASGLLACYVAGIPFFWNTLASDAIYVTFLFGGFALAAHFLPVPRQDSLPAH